VRLRFAIAIFINSARTSLEDFEWQECDIEKFWTYGDLRNTANDGKARRLFKSTSFELYFRNDFQCFVFPLFAHWDGYLELLKKKSQIFELTTDKGNLSIDGKEILAKGNRYPTRFF